MATATYRTVRDGVAVKLDEFSPQAGLLMKWIGAKYYPTTREWVYDGAFDELVRPEIAQLPGRMPKWAPYWPAPINDSAAKQIRAYWRYEHFPRTPDEARKLAALRERHQAEPR